MSEKQPVEISLEELNQLIFNEVKNGTTFETYLAVKKLVDSGYSKLQISKALGKDKSWAGKIVSLLVDNSEFECYFSGNDLFYNKKTFSMYYSLDSFLEAEKENLTETECENVKKFLDSDIQDQKEFEEKEGAIFDPSAPIKRFTIYKGFGSENAPSLWIAENLAAFYNDFCLDGQKTQAQGLNLFSKIIRTLMRVGSKSKNDIDRLVEKSRRIIAGEPQPQPKEHKPINPEKAAKAIFDFFKDVQFTENELNEVKRALKKILKIKENKDRIFVDINISIKKELEQDPEDVE